MTILEKCPSISIQSFTYKLVFSPAISRLNLKNVFSVGGGGVRSLEMGKEKYFPHPSICPLIVNGSFWTHKFLSCLRSQREHMSP